jgi:hypothetical protein
MAPKRRRADQNDSEGEYRPQKWTRRRRTSTYSDESENGDNEQVATNNKDIGSKPKIDVETNANKVESYEEEEDLRVDPRPATGAKTLPTNWGVLTPAAEDGGYDSETKSAEDELAKIIDLTHVREGSFSSEGGEHETKHQQAPVPLLPEDQLPFTRVTAVVLADSDLKSRLSVLHKLDSALNCYYHHPDEVFEPIIYAEQHWRNGVDVNNPLWQPAEWDTDTEPRDSCHRRQGCRRICGGWNIRRRSARSWGICLRCLGRVCDL